MTCCLMSIITVLAYIVVPISIFKIFLKLTTGWDRSPTCLVGKTAIVTGANAGIGFYTAQDFAKRGARVILACRNRQRAEDARSKIIEATGNPNVVVRIIDLSSLASVRAFAKEINETEERLDILVNNAAQGGIEHQLTADGLGLTMQSNYFGPFLLTHLLIELLKKSAPSRVVNVSSETARVAKLDLNNLNGPSDSYFTKSMDYANTKLCNCLFTTELARRLRGSGVETYVVQPGAVKTEFLKNLSYSYRIVLDAIALITHKNGEAGAQTSIYASVSKDVIGQSGEYFGECKKGWMPSAAKNKELAWNLWEKSEEFVQLTPQERQLLQ
ncbi:hypothetical protein ILUMI_08568 [Ignelater luminosus]|uniref:Retinol dehydrogenase 11 n=1 Tax=Ignelater luminosus TaxID=2038154 RepID=A0A8K0GFA7_IGNLU|nr:hypothetical protein ILUMI_08568 [Ignelater luminosus]